MRIFLSGATGYLGQRLAAYLVNDGHTVVGSSRRAGSMPHIRLVRLDLGQTVDPALFAESDVVIHAAHDFERAAMDRNIQGVLACFAAAKMCGVGRQIFLSSYSARRDAVSEYGRTKYRIEQTFLDSGEVVLRPGLVVGNGGLFARQREALLRTPVVPVIGAGASPTAVIAIQHFLDATGVVVRKREPGEYALFYEERPTMRQFVRAIKMHAGQRFLFLPLPASVAMALIRLVRAVGLNLPADSDQIKALRLSRISPWRSDLPVLLPGREAEFCFEYALTQLTSNL